MKTIGLSYFSYWGDQAKDPVCNDVIFHVDLVLELARRGYRVLSLQPDIDKGNPVFGDFLGDSRKEAWKINEFTPGTPQLDILFVQWRWKIPGRNWMEDGSKPPMMDYLRQEEILNYYHDKTDTKIFILDTDFKLTEEDERRYFKATILDISNKSKKLWSDRKSVFWPFNTKRILERKHLVRFPLQSEGENAYSLDPSNLISYIGNDYERENQFAKYIYEISKTLPPWTVHVYGNWLKYPAKAATNLKKYEGVVFHPKVTRDNFEYIYSRTLCVPLLSKDDYAEHGQMAYRILEVMYNGSIPVGLKEFYGIEKYVIPELIVGSIKEFEFLIEKLITQTPEERLALWEKQAKHFSYSAEEFVNVLERI